MSASQPSILRAVFILGLALLCGAVVLWAASQAHQTQPPDRIPAPLVIRHPTAARAFDRHTADAGWDEFRMTGTVPIAPRDPVPTPVWCFESFDVGAEDLRTTSCHQTRERCEEVAAGEGGAHRRATGCTSVTALWCFPAASADLWSCHLNRARCAGELEELQRTHRAYRDGRGCARRWARGP